MNGKDFLQRYGSHLVIVLGVAAVILIGGTDAFGSEEPASPGPPIVVEDLPTVVSVDRAPNESNPQDVQIDMSSVPELTSYSLSPSLNPITFQGIRPSHEVVTYTVERNDTPIGIAEKFNIAPETILGGNPLLSEESSALQTGSVLTILPIDGVLHDVAEGETLERLAELYSVQVEDIVAYEANNLEFPYRLYPGTQIMVPGAVREIFVWTAPALPSRPSGSASAGSGVEAAIVGNGFFIWPVGNRRITQHYWYGHQAIDIGSPEGSTVVASDTGTVTWAGWNVYGYGNLIVINHGNGFETYYAHLRAINVFPGQIVYQGNVIGASGNTGRSSGPHLHFEIRLYNGLYEPLAYLP